MSKCINCGNQCEKLNSYGICDECLKGNKKQFTYISSSKIADTSKKPNNKSLEKTLLYGIIMVIILLILEFLLFHDNNQIGMQIGLLTFLIISYFIVKNKSNNSNNYDLQPSVSNRLYELNKLYEEKLITEEEYNNKRKEILSKL